MSLVANNSQMMQQYCPSQKAYVITVAGTSRTASLSGLAGYQSLYNDNRKDLDAFDTRKETYIFYPSSEVPTASLAAAGFYYTGENDISRCFCCKLEIGRLRRGEDPMEVHRRKSTNCPFVRRAQFRDSSDCDEDCIDGPDNNFSSGSSLKTDGPHNFEPAVKRPDCTTSTREVERNKPLLVMQQKDQNPAKTIDKEALRRDNERLRSTITCRKCHVTRVQTLFLPCRHLVACEECAEKMDDCINCGQKILGTVRTFLI